MFLAYYLWLVYIFYFRQNQTIKQKLAVEAERKASKSAAEKQQKEARALKRLAQSDEDWVISLISEIFSDVPIISEKQNVRRTTNTKAAKL